MAEGETTGRALSLHPQLEAGDTVGLAGTETRKYEIFSWLPILKLSGSFWAVRIKE